MVDRHPEDGHATIDINDMQTKNTGIHVQKLLNIIHKHYEVR